MGPDDPIPMSVDNTSDAECMLETLRDGDHSQVFIDRTPASNPGWCGFRRRITILKHRRVIVVEGEYEDLGGENIVRTGKLKSKSTFQDCLDAGPNYDV